MIWLFASTYDDGCDWVREMRITQPPAALRSARILRIIAPNTNPSVMRGLEWHPELDRLATTERFRDRVAAASAGHGNISPLAGVYSQAEHARVPLREALDLWSIPVTPSTGPRFTPPYRVTVVNGRRIFEPERGPIPVSFSPAPVDDDGAYF